MKFDPYKCNFDPNLKMAAEEMKEILKKYDIGGHITLVSPTHSEFMFAISPSWSCARFTADTNQIHFKATQEMFGSKEECKKAQERSLHLILQIRDMGAQAFHVMENVRVQLSKFFDIDHVPFSTKPPKP